MMLSGEKYGDFMMVNGDLMLIDDLCDASADCLLCLFCWFCTVPLFFNDIHTGPGPSCCLKRPKTSPSNALSAQPRYHQPFHTRTETKARRFGKPSSTVKSKK